jgi:hypothetical protein
MTFRRAGFSAGFLPRFSFAASTNELNDRIIGVTNSESPSLRLQASVRIQQRSARAPSRPGVLKWLSSSTLGQSGSYEDGFLLVGVRRGSSAVCARCHAASRSRRSSATSALAVSRIASA